MSIKTVAKALDFVEFHSDVINTLRAVNAYRPRTTVAIVFVKTPVQLTLICFSAVTAILAAVREIFTALGYFLFDPGPQRFFDHTIRAGAQLLGVPVAIFGALFALIGEPEWVVSRHIDLGNYIPPPPVRPRSTYSGPLPPVPSRDDDPLLQSEDDLSSSESGSSDSSDASDSESKASTAPRQDTQLQPSYTRPRSAEFRQRRDGLKPVDLKPAGRSTQQRVYDKRTLRPQDFAKFIQNKPTEQRVFVVKVQRAGKDGWESLISDIVKLKDTIPEFIIPNIQDEFEQNISDLSDYLKAKFEIASIQLNHPYTVEDWEFTFERFETVEDRPLVFISKRASPGMPTPALQVAEPPSADATSNSAPTASGPQSQQRQKPRAQKHLQFQKSPLQKSPPGGPALKPQHAVAFSKEPTAIMSSSSDRNRPNA